MPVIKKPSTLLAQGRLTQAMVTKEAARSVVITFASGSQVTLANATITGAVPGANGTATIQVTYQSATTGKTETDDWLSH
jgi:hypothetical protein